MAPTRGKNRRRTNDFVHVEGFVFDEGCKLISALLFLAFR